MLADPRAFPAGTVSAWWFKRIGRRADQGYSSIGSMRSHGFGSTVEDYGAPGQRCLLGHGDQTRPGAWGSKGYPVFTRKAHYGHQLHGLRQVARKLLGHDATGSTRNSRPIMRPFDVRRFSTWPARRPSISFEFQRLHGMGEALHEHGQAKRSGHTLPDLCARSDAHSDLLAYLVRRLLENGANSSSFVNQIVDLEDHITQRPSRATRSRSPRKPRATPERFVITDSRLPSELFGSTTTEQRKAIDLDRPGRASCG